MGIVPINPTSRTRRARRIGTAATELALSLPMLLLLALACTDFGRVPHFQQIVANAARTGAETGATHQFTAFTRASWEAGIEQAVIDEMQNIPEFNPGEMDFTLSTIINADGLAQIEVVLSYPFRTLIAWPGLPSEVVLHERSAFVQFR